MNLTEWRTHLLERLDRQIAATSDPVLVALRDELTAYPATNASGNGSDGPGGDVKGADGPAATDGAQLAGDIVVVSWLRAGDGELAFFSTIATFGTAIDVTISELAIESFFPADRATVEYLRGR